MKEVNVLRDVIQEELSKMLFEYVTQSELNSLEQYLDKLFGHLDIDVEFTRHFVDRVNDVRNEKDIEIEELRDIFVKTYKKWGVPISNYSRDAEAVITDMSTDINVPVKIEIDPYTGDIDLVNKTVMRKRRFHTKGDRRLTV